jgi:hypothetical protein
MRVLYSPQVNPGQKITYKFQGETIVATFNGVVSDVFDFSGMPDGSAVNIETILAVKPIVNAERVNGVLSVELLNFIDHDATEQEKFPTWQEV